MHAAITGMLAALVALPLFGFARARGVRWFGLVVLVPLGVLAPAGFLALANGAGAAVASVPFTTAAVFSLLVTRRDRGWWALVVLFRRGDRRERGAARAAAARRNRRRVDVRALRHVRAPLPARHAGVERCARSPSPTIAAVLGLLAVGPLLALGGAARVGAAAHAPRSMPLVSWPFGWLGTDLSADGPPRPGRDRDLAGRPGAARRRRDLRRRAQRATRARRARRRDRRRAVTAGIGLIDRQRRHPPARVTLLSRRRSSRRSACAPCRWPAPTARTGGRRAPRGRFGGIGPTLLVVAFVVLSFSATVGHRHAHGARPSVDLASASRPGTDHAHRRG